ncbi:Isochorismatase hydrolase [Penicillium riverlandense]|uniref:Isochorismatase hydrolase n=1 Tax=Penicillium riverlandense TaxID=1903569 RepID=UPI002548FFA9|nr:Isochorismatase hydrolase [Penicillium riverlandense]KAJ5806832.1 Isochorismatase hydrolase [Penicillium riverlandense]
MASPPPVLLVIDLQQGIVEAADWGPRSTPRLTENVAHLLQTWRSRSWPVLHVYHDELNEPDNPAQVKFPETFAPHTSAAPLASEPQFIKHQGSAFVGTKLQEELERLEKDGKRKIVVIGMDGSQCVNNTVRHATDLGFQMLVAADACACYGMEDWRTGKQLGAEETWEAAMGVLTGCAKVVATDKVLTALGYE